MINRPYYLNQLWKARHTDFIKIITGIRRSGKSTLLQLFKNALLEDGISSDHILHISYEKITSYPLEKASALYTYIKEQIKNPTETYYLLIDEVQELEEWAKVINGLKNTFPLDIYVTGSNSRLFSGEYLTYITGRYIEIKVYPLSLSEFMTFRGYDTTQKEQAFQEYLQIGSFPAVALTKDPALIDTINSGLFDSIFARDIIIRGGIRNEGIFLKVAKFIIENIGNPLSANSIAKTLKSQGSSVSTDTVDNYLTQMVNAFVLYQCERYDIRGKERLRTNGKYYVADLGLRNQLIGFRKGNMGHVIENLVFLELLRRGYTISTGLYNSLEVDFVATKGTDIRYYQVSLSVMDEKVLQREIAPFYKINDNYPKYLITMDPISLTDNGIIHQNLFDFFLENNEITTEPPVFPTSNKHE